MTDQPVGEYPDITLTESLCNVQKAVQAVNDVAWATLREAHDTIEEQRRQVVALDAKLTNALVRGDEMQAQRDAAWATLTTVSAERDTLRASVAASRGLVP